MATIAPILDPLPAQTLPQSRIDASPAVISDDVSQIHAEYDLLRQQCPAAYTTAYGGYWLLTRHADIKAAAMDSDTFISSVKAVIPSDPRGIRRPPLNFDAPRHTPFRTALDRTLKPARIKRLEGRLAVRAREVLAPLLERGEGDVASEFGAKFAAWVETEWLNLEPETAPVLADSAARWVDAWRRMDGAEVGRWSGKLYEIARALVKDRRDSPRDAEEDPASSLLLERGPDGGMLDEEHLV
jgi:cytochrome P450